MEKIFPQTACCCMVRDNKHCICDSISELGIYSVIFTRNDNSSGNKLIENTTIGALLRTKPNSCNEGGVMVGASVIDYPFILPAAEIAEINKD